MRSLNTKMVSCTMHRDQLLKPQNPTDAKHEVWVSVFSVQGLPRLPRSLVNPKPSLRDAWGVRVHRDDSGPLKVLGFWGVLELDNVRLLIKPLAAKRKS